MSHKDGIMEFKLRKTIKYSLGGNFPEASFLALNEPTGPHNKTMRRLSSMVNSLILAVAEKRKKPAEDEEKITQVKKSLSDLTEEEGAKDSDELAQMLAFSFSSVGDIDREEDFIEEFHKAIIKQSSSPLCLLDGHDEAPFREAHWEKMDYRDQMDIAVKYAAFFGIGYLGHMMEKSD